MPTLPAKLPVLFDHDGGVDDFLSLLLLTMPHVELLGVSITPADCYPEPALETTGKLLHLLGQPQLPLMLVPLDVTNQVPVNLAFLRQLAAQVSHPLSYLAGQFWATTVATIPTYEYTYFMWDVLATSYLAIPEAFEVETLELAIIPAGASAGRTLRQPGSGHWVQVARHVDTDIFYAYLLRQFGAVGSQLLADAAS